MSGFYLYIDNFNVICVGLFILQFYIEPNVWCQIAIRYTETEVTLFLNGKVTGTRSITGNLILCI